MGSMVTDVLDPGGEGSEGSLSNRICKADAGTSLVVQWVRIHLAMQGMHPGSVLGQRAPGQEGKV